MSSMNFAVEPWAPEYGSPVRAPEVDLDITVNLNVERAAERWEPITPPTDADQSLERIAFIDGARRVDARIWITHPNGDSCQGICASWAAGATVCGETAEIEAIRVERGVFCAARDADSITTRHGVFQIHPTTAEQPDELVNRAHAKMTDLEVAVATDLPEVDLIVFDGPLGKSRATENAVGYVKTHHVQYGNRQVQETVAALASGQRTPVFVATSSWERLTWYMRLPGTHDHAWSGIVRIEAANGRDGAALTALANGVTRALARFASRGHQDPRAPQNLLPIGALERELHHRMGDRGLFLRALRQAAKR